MRALFLLLPAALLAQTPATKDAPKVPAATKAPAAPKGAAPTKAAAPATTMTDEQKTIYALGLSIAQNLQQFALTPAELEIVKKGLSDSIAGKPAVDIGVYGPKLQALANSRAAQLAVKEKAAAGAYLAKAAAEPG